MIWANLLHLSYNMWGDWDNPNSPSPYHNRKPFLRFDEQLWTDLLNASKSAGLNMIVIDLGDGVKYKSHPELAVENAWTTMRLRDEIKRLREMGLEPIPKLNFSTCHDTWLGIYSHMVSTEKYYSVCRDLIAEVCNLFEKPRFFHIGMDEENASLQRHKEFAVIRQHDLWFRDLQFYVDEVERGGSRAWMWSDYVWANPDAFYEKVSKKILQSNWYYRAEFGPDLPRVKEYIRLAKEGFDEIPTMINWTTTDNITNGVAFCQQYIPKEKLLGILLTPWRPTLEETRPRHMEAIETFGKAIKAFNEKA
jgi:hypothetical protein